MDAGSIVSDTVRRSHESIANPQFGLPLDVVGRIERIIQHDISILVQGETGTGKEVLARVLHSRGSYSNGPFVAVNCAALPETLIESELFGYAPGAFTGANREGRRGKIALANRGTLFLDEIGDMPLQLQARLLRVLEGREVEALGSDVAIRVDLRVVSATHRDLPEMVRTGTFREDLYYRLAGFVIDLPPLREREDKTKIVLAVLAEQGDIAERVQINSAALQVLLSFDWPGNMRQLRNVLRVAAAVCENNLVRVGDLPPDLVNGPRQIVDREIVRRNDRDGDLPSNPFDVAERTALLEELERRNWNVSDLAADLRVSRNLIYRKMRRLRCVRPA